MTTTQTSRSARRGKEAVEHPAQEARAKADAGSGWYAWLARGGLVAKGVSFGIVGILAVGVAADSGGKATSRQGALQTLAQHTWGTVLLVLLAIGFAGYAIWRFVQAFAEREDEGGENQTLKKWGKRAGSIGRDGALQKLADASYGPYLLGLTAAGLLCYALFCLVDARYRDVSTEPR